MSSPFMRKVLPQQAAPVFKPLTNTQAGKNPFMLARQMDNPELLDIIGVNKPLRHPMLVTYIGDRPIMAGSRLFVLT